MNNDVLILKLPPNTISTEAKQDDQIVALQSIAGFQIPPFDKTISTEVDTVTETHEFQMGGTTHTTLTVVFSDSTKAFILTITKS